MAEPLDRARASEIDVEPLLETELQDWGNGSDDEFLDPGPKDDEPTDTYALDPYRPFDDLPKERHDILTVRAVLLGLFCGTLVNASNVYLGLRAGWTASANIFGSVVGFTVLKSCAKWAGHIPILGGGFGPRENNIVQTTATASGGMANVFVSAFPALYQLNLLNDPAKDFWRIIFLTAAGGYFGIFFATPLRKFFIIYVARELGLIFPSSSATAITIRSMHMASEGSTRVAQLKVRALASAFVFAAGLRIISQYAIGLLWDWHIFTWIYLLFGHSQGALAAESWGWFIQWTPAMMGSGMLVGLNIGMSFFFGGVLAWGILGPYLVANGLAFGTSATDDSFWAGYESYYSLAAEYTTADHPSPRYWLLWPGILCMVTVALLDLVCQWRVFVLSGRALWKGIQNFRNRKSKSGPAFAPVGQDSGLIQDPALPQDQVPTWIWAPGIVTTLAGTCWVMSSQYGMAVGETLLALALTFFFSFLAIQATGATDITPLSGASMSSQMILGATTQGPGWTVETAQRMNLLGGALASLGASQAADLVGDYRVGFLLRTSPRLQWYAQCLGTACAVFIAPAIYVLFAMAYPCINDATMAGRCQFQVPAASAWRAVAIAVTEPELPVPSSSMKFAVIFALIGGAGVLVRQFVWVGRLAWIRAYHPNMMVVSLAFLIPATHYGTAMFIGALIAALWHRKNPVSFDVLAYAVAAGLMAGEGIGGIFNAVLQILGVSGDVLGTQFGCPNGAC